jgi:uncharacterized NAD-dependent epimerase/dehydratase family protein
VSVNTRGLDDAAAQRFVDYISTATGLPAADPIRTGAGPILEAMIG